MPIRVLHICDKFGVSGSTIHGVSRLLSWWLPRYDSGRFEVRLLGLRPADGASETLRRGGLDLECLGKGKFDFTTLPALLRCFRQWRPDVLHLHGYGASNFGRMAGALAGIPAIVHEHAVFPSVPAYQIPFDRGLSRRMARGLAVSAAVKEFMVRRRYMPEDRVEVLLNGAPLDEFRAAPSETVEEERRRWGIPPGGLVVGTVGRLDEQKGNCYFLEAAARLLQRPGLPGLRFLIVGDGPLSGELRDQCGALGIADKVIFAGYQSDIPRIQSLLDIQVFPSLWEGVPLTLFEAMAMERAIVSTNVDGLGEVLRHEENALLVPPRDAEGLAAAIEKLLCDRDLARSLAAQALRNSREYDVQRTVDRMEEIYDQMAAGRAA